MNLRKVRSIRELGPDFAQFADSIYRSTGVDGSGPNGLYFHSNVLEGIDVQEVAIKPEPWMRGTHGELDPLRRAVVHALELAGEDAERWCASLSDEALFLQPFGLASVAFHLRHIARSLDRLLTYAEGRVLDEEQLAGLRTEVAPGTAAEVWSEFHVGLAGAIRAGAWLRSGELCRAARHRAQAVADDGCRAADSLCRARAAACGADGVDGEAGAGSKVNAVWFTAPWDKGGGQGAPRELLRGCGLRGCGSGRNTGVSPLRGTMELSRSGRDDGR